MSETTPEQESPQEPTESPVPPSTGDEPAMEPNDGGADSTGAEQPAQDDDEALDYPDEEPEA